MGEWLKEDLLLAIAATRIVFVTNVWKGCEDHIPVDQYSHSTNQRPFLGPLQFLDDDEARRPEEKVIDEFC